MPALYKAPCLLLAAASGLLVDSVLSHVVPPPPPPAGGPPPPPGVRGHGPPPPPRGPGSLGAPLAKLGNVQFLGLHNDHYNQDLFLGMPYAQPPVGDLRFAPSVPFAGAAEPLDATEYSPMCIGYGSDTVNAGNHVDEDCLTINVVRPAGVPADADLPVSIWIHGGSYVNGGSSDPRYNLSWVVDQSVKEGNPIIATSINYRVANWGFMFGSELAEAGAGNLGLRDQRLAMHWVRDNIAAFGGSPDKVTLWGESAGARSIGMQMVAYDGADEGLFRSAILESGSPVAQFASAADWQPYFDALVSATDCDRDTGAERLACLRALPWETLNTLFNTTSNQINGVGFPPLSAVIDGDFMTQQGAAALRNGSFAKVDLLLGNNFDEGTAYAKKGINTDDEFNAWLHETLGDGLLTALIGDLLAVVGKLTGIYPDDPAQGIPAAFEGRPASAPWGSQFRRVAAFAGDYQQHSGRRLTAAAYAGAGQAVYSYLFDVLVAGIPAIIGATHFQEVAFVFNNVEGVGYGASNPFAGMPATYAQLADAMSRKWVAFIATGDPNKTKKRAGKCPPGPAGESCDYWPKYEAQNPQNYVFDANATNLHYLAADDYRQDQIQYILEHVY